MCTAHRCDGFKARALRLAIFILFLFPLVASAQALPTGWSSSDIGSPALAGSATQTSGTYTVKAAGVDIWGTSDQFRFVYRQVTGDTTVVARIASLTAADGWSKAGVMIRESLSSRSKHGSMFVSVSNGLAFQRRAATGGDSVHTSGGSSAAPTWVKLERRGSTITASRSSTGTTWTVVGSQTISMTSTVYVGLAVTSHNSATRTTATISNVTVQGGSTPGPANVAPTVSLTAPASGATYTAPANITLTASAADSDGTIAGVDFYRGSTLIGTDTTSPYSVTWSSAPAGTYTLTAVARDNAGASTTSGARSVTVNGTTGNQPPTVSLTAPGSGATFTAPANMTLSANAADADGSIARVEFYQGTTQVGSDSTSPYSVSWNNVAAGTYSIVAVAVDNKGATTTSSARSVTVTGTQAPTKAVFVPSANDATAVSSYTFEVFTAGANTKTATPISTRNLGKPAVVNGECSVDVSATIAALPGGSYIATITAVGPGGSVRSAPSATFTR